MKMSPMMTMSHSNETKDAASWRPIDDDNTGDDESPTWI